MSLKTLDTILASLEKRPEWQVQQQYLQLVRAWERIVGPQIAGHSRPLQIRRQVLWVATESSAWAQTLSFQRHGLLERLNPQLPEPLADIRFSPAQWYSRPSSATSPPASPTSHPSWLAPETLSPDPASESARSGWIEEIQRRWRHLPLCPHCQCPTPPGELERWSSCAYCAARQWASLQQGKKKTDIKMS